MTIFTIEEAIKNGGNAILLLRHAERPPLDPGDTTFGMNLPITERGRETARRYGMKLSHIVEPDAVRVYASETLRTRQTAECILEGLCEEGQRKAPLVTLLPELGSESPFFGRLDERMALIFEGRYRDRLNEYFREGIQSGYKPLAVATEKMKETLLSLEKEEVPLVVAVTHDINVAAFLAGCGIKTEFDESLWPYYLDAALILQMKNGEKRYGYFRHDPSFDGLDL